MLRCAGYSFLVVVLLGQAAPAVARGGQPSLGGPITNQGSGTAHTRWSHEGAAAFSPGGAFSRRAQGHWMGPGLRYAVPFGIDSGLPIDDYDVISPGFDYPFGSACRLELRAVKTLHFLTWRPVPVCGD